MPNETFALFDTSEGTSESKERVTRPAEISSASSEKPEASFSRLIVGEMLRIRHCTLMSGVFGLGMVTV